MPKKGFRGLGELSGMTDEQARALVLGNWHKFNAFLRSQPGLTDLRRLMALELVRGPEARDNMLERLRSAISSNGSRESKGALSRVSAALVIHAMPDFRDVERLLGYSGAGVTPPQVRRVLDELKRMLT